MLTNILTNSGLDGLRIWDIFKKKRQMTLVCITHSSEIGNWFQTELKFKKNEYISSHGNCF